MTQEGHPHLVHKLVLTARGERIVSGEYHPLCPGFIERFRGRAPNVSDEVVSRMEDAVSCVEKSLLRAAVKVALAVTLWADAALNLAAHGTLPRQPGAPAECARRAAVMEDGRQRVGQRL
jgi:hypothetical protein